MVRQVSGGVANRIGTVVGDRFRLDELIGRGAMAEVYRALDLTTSAYVALKILRHTHITDATSLARFAREADVQARLRHRNVAALLATGVTADRKEPYLAVELLRGKRCRAYPLFTTPASCTVISSRRTSCSSPRPVRSSASC